MTEELSHYLRDFHFNEGILTVCKKGDDLSDRNFERTLRLLVLGRKIVRSLIKEGDLDKGLEYSERTIKIAIEAIGTCYCGENFYLQGLIHKLRNQYLKALSCFKKALIDEGLLEEDDALEIWKEFKDLEIKLNEINETELARKWKNKLNIVKEKQSDIFKQELKLLE